MYGPIKITLVKSGINRKVFIKTLFNSQNARGIKLSIQRHLALVLYVTTRTLCQRHYGTIKISFPSTEILDVSDLFLAPLQKAPTKS